MTPSPYDIPDCSHFTAGTVGPPGGRIFHLQAAAPGVLVTLRCEKQHVLALAEAIGAALPDLPTRPIGTLPPTADLIDPIEVAWVVGGIGLAYDEDADRIVVVAGEATESEDDDGAVARWSITREQALTFVARARELAEGGRPTCPLCERPIDRDGHTCPKTNGHRPH